MGRKADVPVLPDAGITGDDTATWGRRRRRVSASPCWSRPSQAAAARGCAWSARRRCSSSRRGRAPRGRRTPSATPTVFLERYLDALPAHRDPGLRRHARQCRAPGRAGVLGPAPPPEGPRGGTLARSSPRSCASPWAPQRCPWSASSATSAPARSSTCSTTETGEFYFLEMNTRLQVEHPVTEEVTGLDLVALQLRVAPRRAARASARTRSRLDGHAIEVRLYAEDPAQDYLPTPGALHRYAHPVRPGLRFEDGVAAPAEISPFYDPMLAKVIARADTRAEAAGALAAALDATQVHGVTTNRDFLAAAAARPRLPRRGDAHRLPRPPPAPARPADDHGLARGAPGRRDRRLGGAARAAPTRSVDMRRPGSGRCRRAADPARPGAGQGGEPVHAGRLPTRAAGTGTPTFFVDVDGARARVRPARPRRPDGVRVRHDGVDYPVHGAPCTPTAPSGSTTPARSPAGARSRGCPSRGRRAPPRPARSTRCPGTVVAVRSRWESA